VSASSTTTKFVVQYAEQDGKDLVWFDTSSGECETLESARIWRKTYDRTVGAPSRIIERVTTETIIDDAGRLRTYYSKLAGRHVTIPDND
jgi:hypothetical protein